MTNRPEQRTAKSRGRRRVNTRERKSTILIVCEGKKTEPNYFNGLIEYYRIRLLADVDVIGTGCNTASLVTEALRIKNERERRSDIFYDEVWCVFDRDSFPPNQFNQALTLAGKSNIQVAYSNEAFELWYLLHFDYLDTGITRQQYCHKLNQKLRVLYQCNYEKNDDKMFERLLEKQSTAIQNAKTLLSSYPMCDPEQNKPSTTVHLLVEKLNTLLKP